MIEFEQALKLLAEKEPSKFQVTSWNGLFAFGFRANPFHRKRVADFTQDFIDQILAALNQRIVIRVMRDYEGTIMHPLTLVADVFGLDWKPLRTFLTSETELLPAKKEGLTRWVEEEYAK